ncbi:hypothetical protein ACHAWX_000959 [Stephanocyclus meneghinianus]
MGKKMHNRRTVSTLGADYYVKKMANPLFGQQIDESSDWRDCSNCCRATAADDLQNSHESYSSKSFLNGKLQHRNDRLYNQSHVLVQLWDTRGAEPALPVYQGSNRSPFNIHQFLSLKPDRQDVRITDGHGYHLHRYNNWGTSRKLGPPSCCAQCIDLNESKARISAHCSLSCRNDSNHLPISNNDNSPSSNALYNNIDACMLVYDATSSTSFLRLMSYHEELVRRFRCQDLEQHNCRMLELEQKCQTPTRRVPFIVVANKIDLLDDILDSSTSDLRRRHRRCVMGFDTYCGMDEIYEYAAENTSATKTQSFSCNQRSSSYNHRQRCLLSESSFPSKSKSKQPNHINKLTFSLKETAWSSDTHYLRSLQQADDQLSVNRTMVLLWCERNGLQHVEASALYGRGVDLAMGELVRLALLERLRREELNEDALEWTEEGNDVDDIYVADANNDLNNRQPYRDVSTLEHRNLRSTTYENNCVLRNDRKDPLGQTPWNTQNSYLDQQNIDNSQYTFLYEPRYEKKLDLFARYSTKEDKRCALNCLR